jgi:hypothetical protein
MCRRPHLKVPLAINPFSLSFGLSSFFVRQREVHDSLHFESVKQQLLCKALRSVLLQRR